ncbi:MAG: PilZ domain-containing protein, partial [Pseudomonadota bacterium]
SERRANTEIGGQVKINTFSTVNCTVKDLSVSGAQLILSKPVKKLPKRFSLTLQSDHSPKKRTCSCRWQDGQSIGVEFHYS